MLFFLQVIHHLNNLPGYYWKQKRSAYQIIEVNVTGGVSTSHPAFQQAPWVLLEEETTNSLNIRSVVFFCKSSGLTTTSLDITESGNDQLNQMTEVNVTVAFL